MALSPQDLLALYVERVSDETIGQRLLQLIDTLTPAQRATAFGIMQADLVAALQNEEGDVSARRSELQDLITDVQAVDPPSGGG